VGGKDYAAEKDERGEDRRAWKVKGSVAKRENAQQNGARMLSEKGGGTGEGKNKKKRSHPHGGRRKERSFGIKEYGKRSWDPKSLAATKVERNPTVAFTPEIERTAPRGGRHCPSERAREVNTQGRIRKLKLTICPQLLKCKNSGQRQAYTVV